MNSLHRELADAVVGYLSTQSFSMPFTPEFKRVPTYTTAQLQTLRVVVIPSTRECVPADRSTSWVDVAVDVGITKICTGEEYQRNVAFDALDALADEIFEALNRAQLQDYPTAMMVKIAREPIWDPAHWEADQRFTTVITVTYRVRI